MEHRVLKSAHFALEKSKSCVSRQFSVFKRTPTTMSGCFDGIKAKYYHGLMSGERVNLAYDRYRTEIGQLCCQKALFLS